MCFYHAFGRLKTASVKNESNLHKKSFKKHLQLKSKKVTINILKKLVYTNQGCERSEDRKILK